MATIFKPYELEVLKKFKYGAKIKNEEELKILERWALVGFVKFGFLSGTAKLTEDGKFAVEHND